MLPMSSTYAPPLVDDIARLRVVGALVGGSVPAVVGAAAWWLGVPYVAAVAAAGVPIGALLAGGTAVRATLPSWPGLVLVLAAIAPLVAAAVLVAGSAGGGEPGQLLGGILFVGVFALILGVPVTAPLALVAVVLLRRLGRMPVPQATRAAAALAALALVLGGPTLLAAVGPLAGAVAQAGIGPVDWAARTAAVRLELVVENRTPVDRYLEVMADVGDGSSSGSAFGVGPCETVTKRLNVESAVWTVVEGDETSDDPLAGRQLATADVAPGADPSLLLVFGPGSTVDVRADGPMPGDGIVDPEVCR